MSSHAIDGDFLECMNFEPTYHDVTGSFSNLDNQSSRTTGILDSHQGLQPQTPKTPHPSMHQRLSARNGQSSYPPFPDPNKQATFLNGMNPALMYQNSPIVACPESMPDTSPGYYNFNVSMMPSQNSPSQPFPSEIRELGALPMSGYSHIGPEPPSASSPGVVSDRFNEFSEDEETYDPSFVSPNTPNQQQQPRSAEEVKLRWSSYQEARGYRTQINRRFNTDVTVPQSDLERQNIVKELIFAMKHVDDDSEEQSSTRPFKISKYKDDVIEMCAWNLLEMTIHRHINGPLRTAWQDRTKGSPSYPTFMDRIDAIKTSMRKRKMIVKHVLDTPYVYTFIDDPEGCRKRVETNKSLNRKKALVMTAGKQYLQQQFASPNSNGDNGDCEIIFDGPNKRSQRSSSSASKPATKPKSDTMTSSPPTDRRQSTNSRRQPSALGSPFSTPHAPMKRETFFTGLGMPMRNPQLSRFDSSPAYPYGSSLSTDYTFSPDHQQTSTPGSSLPGSYGAAGFDHCLMGGMHMGVPHSHMSTPLISQDGFHTPSTQRPHGLGFPSMAYSRNGTDTSTVSPPSLFTNAGAHENNGYAAMMSNGGANFPPQMSSPKKRAIGNSVVTASEADHPSQKRMMNNS